MSIALEAKVTELQRRLTETEMALAAAINRILALEQRNKPGPKPKDGNG
jgi:hypothetical protein